MIEAQLGETRQEKDLEQPWDLRLKSEAPGLPGVLPTGCCVCMSMANDLPHRFVSVVRAWCQHI
jgi:hypothetical protein